ncbi:cyclic GMP-AMP synthase isoform X2 [Betta splendens]|uniref:Cyclic GMP-AMP synthase isoform X2 n=1 Tax=Betta splendens TaxID=158456 RepID=A0A6P7PF31_BETSP|nr:cyclic GMP-AMP synthase isoform X2 [Betta splendens]
MTGRGRPRKAQSPENKCSKSKTKEKGIQPVTVPRHQAEEKCKTKPKKDEELKDSKQKEMTRSKEKNPPKKTTAKSLTDINKLQQTPDGSKKASACWRAAEEMQSKTLLGTAKDPVQTPKAKTSGDVTKSPECAQRKETKKDSIKSTRTCNEKIKPTEDTTHLQPETQERRDSGAAVDLVLNKTLEKLKIKTKDRSNAAEAINAIKKKIITHLKKNSQFFKDVEEPLGTGSYYEHLKISNPDEFDVMVPICVDRAMVKPFPKNDAFYSVSLKRGSPLLKFQEDDILSADKMLVEFREEVKKCIKPLEEWTLTKKKKGCPAVTLTTNVHAVTISLDFVLCLMVQSSWPDFTKEGLKIEAWLGSKVKQDYKRKPYYLVPKYEGKGTDAWNGVLTKDAWRVSFSHIEKAILNNHGKQKTCCEKDGERCCRKNCLKLLKHLLSLLKETDSTLDKFCSYHVKTTLLHACCSRTEDSDWSVASLSHCFNLLLENFITYLEEGHLPNFFIPSQNLFSGIDQKKRNTLASRIREERDNCFSIFK